MPTFARRLNNVETGKLINEEAPKHLACARCAPRAASVTHADDYKQITEEDLDEFSTVGRKMIAEIAGRLRFS